MRSLRARLVLLTMAGKIFVLIATGVVVHRQHSKQLLHNFDASLRSVASNLSERLLHEDHLVSVDDTYEPLHVRREAGHAEPTVQVFDLDGKAVYEINPEWALDVGPVLGDLAIGRVTASIDASGAEIRAYAVRVNISAVGHLQRSSGLDESIGGTLVVSARSAHIHVQSHDLALLIVKISVLSTLLAGVLTWFTVGYGLRPLGALATRIAQTTPETLGAKISAQDQPTEVVPVVDRLNDLLGRLDEALVRERTMSTNVAHELRTPVAALITTLEVRLNEKVGQEDERVLRECLAVSKGMQSIVSSLLALSRIESGQVTVDSTDTPVLELINELWETVGREGVTLSCESSEELVIYADRDLLRLAFTNALTNAVQHAPEGSVITVTAEQASSSKVVTVHNLGCTLEPQDAEKVFDRFWRQDTARSDANLHCGLGATLIRQAAEAAGASVSARVEEDKFTLTFEFPV